MSKTGELIEKIGEALKLKFPDLDYSVKKHTHGNSIAVRWNGKGNKKAIFEAVNDCGNTFWGNAPERYYHEIIPVKGEKKIAVIFFELLLLPELIKSIRTLEAGNFRLSETECVELVEKYVYQQSTTIKNRKKYSEKIEQFRDYSREYYKKNHAEIMRKLHDKRAKQKAGGK